MFDIEYQVKPMTITDAVAFVEAGRQHYNQLNPDDLQSFADIVDMMFSDQGDCNDDVDFACMQALSNLYYQQNLRKAGYIKQLEKLVDPVRVKSMLSDPELFSQ